MLYVRHGQSAVVILPTGHLDASVAPVLRAAVTQLADGQDMVVDLRDVSFVDSAPLGALVAGIRLVTSAGGRVSVICPRPGLLAVLRSTGIERLASVLPGPDPIAA